MTGGPLTPPSPPEGERDGTHPLSGTFSVEDSARLIRNYRYAVERMMRILGGWIALTPELSAKLLMGRHVWDNAQHADALGKRLPELRSRAESEPVNAAFVLFMDAVEAPQLPHQTVERLAGVYGVLKPHLLGTYGNDLRQVNEVYEPPTEKILRRCIEDERRHIAAGATVMRHLVTTPALEERARVWQGKLEGLLAAAGGVTGRGLPVPVACDPLPAATLNDDAREFIRLEQSVTRWPVPEELHAALKAFGAALVASDAAGARRWLAPGVEWSAAAESELSRLGLRSYRVVAFAKVGSQRVVKIRLEGAAGAAALTMRWVPVEGGWRAAALDVAGAGPARPA